MELFNRQIFAILERPLDLTTKLVLGLLKEDGSASHTGSADGLYKPSPLTHSPITSNPLIPAFLVLLAGFLVLYSSPVKTWLNETEGLPTLAQIFSFSRKQAPPSLPQKSERVSVWAKTESGFYYCQGGTLFDSQPGTMMAQIDALTSGYRPSAGEYCTGGQQIDAASGSLPLENQQKPEQASMSAPQEEVLDQSLAKPSEISNAGAGISVWAPTGAQQLGGARTVSPPGVESRAALSNKPDASITEGGVQVWVKTEFGFYYCRNDVLFGSRPGRLMTQASALTAGYQPSDGRCPDGEPTLKTAAKPPSH